MQVLRVGEITAISNDSNGESEVLLFRRNEGLLARVVVPQKGLLLQQRLEQTIERITGWVASTPSNERQAIVARPS